MERERRPSGSLSRLASSSLSAVSLVTSRKDDMLSVLASALRSTSPPSSNTSPPRFESLSVSTSLSLSLCRFLRLSFFYDESDGCGLNLEGSGIGWKCGKRQQEESDHSEARIACDTQR